MNKLVERSKRCNSPETVTSASVDWGAGFVLGGREVESDERGGGEGERVKEVRGALPLPFDLEGVDNATAGEEEEDFVLPAADGVVSLMTALERREADNSSSESLFLLLTFPRGRVVGVATCC